MESEVFFFVVHIFVWKYFLRGSSAWFNPIWVVGYNLKPTDPLAKLRLGQYWWITYKSMIQFYCSHHHSELNDIMVYDYSSILLIIPIIIVIIIYPSITITTIIPLFIGELCCAEEFTEFSAASAPQAKSLRREVKHWWVYTLAT